MPVNIAYPDTVGFRAGFQSTIVKVDGQEFVGYMEGKLSRKRTRAIVKGANADPLGKTRGSNEYEASITVYAAEFKAFMVDHFGAGYGDRQFTFEVTVTEQGYDTQTHYARGCTIDETELSFAEGTEALKYTTSLNPTKILFCGVDDNARPLSGAVAIA